MPWYESFLKSWFYQQFIEGGNEIGVMAFCEDLVSIDLEARSPVPYKQSVGAYISSILLSDTVLLFKFMDRRNTIPRSGLLSWNYLLHIQNLNMKMTWKKALTFASVCAFREMYLMSCVFMSRSSSCVYLFASAVLHTKVCFSNWC